MPKFDNDNLGTRMKSYEKMFGGQKLIPLLPAMIRLDGVSFHTFTKGLRRPYDERLSKIMVETTKFLVKETNARIGYTQSDEISLLLYSDSYDSQIYFDGKISKIMSVLPARASVFFNSLLKEAIPEKADKAPVFDCRAWSLPNKMEAMNALLWREKDATRNSISMAAQSMYSATQLHGKSSSIKQEMMFQKGVNWNDYPSFFKRGTYIQRREAELAFSTEELSKLPAKHAAHVNPDLKIKRSYISEVELLPLSKIENNIEVLFDGAEPKERI